jgi:hypothetical protein
VRFMLDSVLASVDWGALALVADHVSPSCSSTAFSMTVVWAEELEGGGGKEKSGRTEPTHVMLGEGGVL